MSLEIGHNIFRFRALQDNYCVNVPNKTLFEIHAKSYTFLHPLWYLTETCVCVNNYIVSCINVEMKTYYQPDGYSEVCLPLLQLTVGGTALFPLFLMTLELM